MTKTSFKQTVLIMIFTFKIRFHLHIIKDNSPRFSSFLLFLFSYRDFSEVANCYYIKENIFLLFRFLAYFLTSPKLGYSQHEDLPSFVLTGKPAKIKTLFPYKESSTCNVSL